jgi:hypothetical protein
MKHAGEFFFQASLPNNHCTGDRIRVYCPPPSQGMNSIALARQGNELDCACTPAHTHQTCTRACTHTRTHTHTRARDQSFPRCGTRTSPDSAPEPSELPMVSCPARRVVHLCARGSARVLRSLYANCVLGYVTPHHRGSTAVAKRRTLTTTVTLTFCLSRLPQGETARRDMTVLITPVLLSTTLTFRRRRDIIVLTTHIMLIMALIAFFARGAVAACGVKFPCPMPRYPVPEVTA